MHSPGHHFRERLGNALVRHMSNIDAAEALEQLGGEMSAAPTPPDENSNSPGFAFAIATSSLTDLTPSDGLTTSTEGTLTVVVIPTKSRGS